MQSLNYHQQRAEFGSFVWPPSSGQHTTWEQPKLNEGAWITTLSPSLQREIFRYVHVERYRPGEHVDGSHWIACMQGTARLSLATARERRQTLDYLEPGRWWGDDSILGDEASAFELHAHDKLTTFQIGRREFLYLFRAHEEFRQALLRKQNIWARALYERVDDSKSLHLEARVANTLRDLAQRHGVTTEWGIRITLSLNQVALADWIGASRQRVNACLRRLERDHIILKSASGLLVTDLQALEHWAKKSELALQQKSKARPGYLALCNQTDTANTAIPAKVSTVPTQPVDVQP